MNHIWVCLIRHYVKWNSIVFLIYCIFYTFIVFRLTKSNHCNCQEYKAMGNLSSGATDRKKNNLGEIPTFTHSIQIKKKSNQLFTAVCVPNRCNHLFCLSWSALSPRLKMRENPKAWVATRTGMDGKYSNGDTSSGDCLRGDFHHYRDISSHFLLWL